MEPRSPFPSTCPSAALLLQEVHYNQHGLLLLQGQGIYRLGEQWYPVQAGDAIWMAPYVPQVGWMGFRDLRLKTSTSSGSSSAWCRLGF